MSQNLHTRAQQLIAQSLIEGLSAADQAWLDAHLRECPACAREAIATREALLAFRNVPVPVPPGLAARTQMRVRLRAQESMQASGSSALLWVITAASWLLGIFSAPLVWRGFAWAGAQLNVPKLALELGFVLWWAVPALVAVAVVLHQRAVSAGPVGRSSGFDRKP
ncbi:MAG TPA: zf-HC2 domain-containing protein [Candidatus Acidoferrum sp.]